MFLRSQYRHSQRHNVHKRIESSFLTGSAIAFEALTPANLSALSTYNVDIETSKSCAIAIGDFATIANVSLSTPDSLRNLARVCMPMNPLPGAAYAVKQSDATFESIGITGTRSSYACTDSNHRVAIAPTRGNPSLFPLLQHTTDYSPDCTYKSRDIDAQPRGHSLT